MTPVPPGDQRPGEVSNCSSPLAPGGARSALFRVLVGHLSRDHLVVGEFHQLPEHPTSQYSSGRFRNIHDTTEDEDDQAELRDQGRKASAEKVGPSWPVPIHRASRRPEMRHFMPCLLDREGSLTRSSP